MSSSTHSTITPAALQLAEAVDNALSSTGEFNHYTASYSLLEIKEMARAILAKEKRKTAARRAALNQSN